jgi:hypothetical protein
MTKQLTKYLKEKYKKMALLTQCLLLLLKNLLLIRMLKLRSVSLYDRVVIEDNEIEILWKVKGCHKIKIKGLGYFSGNIHGLKLIFTNSINPIEITFCGIAKKITRKFSIKSSTIKLQEKFIAKTNIPIAVAVRFNKEKLQCELTKHNLKVNLENIYFELEPFNLDNYKPLSQ